MTNPSPPALDYEPKPPPSRAWLTRDEIAYVAPMAAFLALIWLGGRSDALYPIAYVARVAIVAVLLIYFRRHYTKIRWNYWWLGVIVGVIGIVQWVPMQLWLQSHVAFFKPKPDAAFNPFKFFAGQSPAVLWSFIAIRIL